MIGIEYFGFCFLRREVKGLLCMLDQRNQISGDEAVDREESRSV